MDKLTKSFAVILAVLGLLYLVFSGRANPAPSTFLLYLFLSLVTRYPKVSIMDTFMLTDCTELFVYLTALYISYPLAIAMLFLSIGIPQVIEIRMESPAASINRIISTLVSLAFFAVFMKFGMSLFMACVIGIFISGLIWSLIEWFVLHLTNPTYFLVALVKPIVFYRIFKAIGFG